MISRRTIFSLLLALLLGGGIFAWNDEKRDACDGYPASSRDATQVVVGQSTKADRLAPCSQWFPRQPLSVQALCVADGALVALFLMSIVIDVSNRRARR